MSHTWRSIILFRFLFKWRSFITRVFVIPNSINLRFFRPFLSFNLFQFIILNSQNYFKNVAIQWNKLFLSHGRRQIIIIHVKIIEIFLGRHFLSKKRYFGPFRERDKLIGPFNSPKKYFASTFDPPKRVRLIETSFSRTILKHLRKNRKIRNSELEKNKNGER